jgi:hypothetical protein
MPSSMSRDQLLRQQASSRVLQERYDNCLSAWGARADAKPLSHDVDDYRRDHLVRIKKLLPENHELRKVQVRSLPSDALNVLEPQILKAASDSAFRPDAVPRGHIERRESIDGNSGRKIVHWLGQESFVKEMGRPGRRVTSFRVDGHYVAADGRPLR